VAQHTRGKELPQPMSSWMSDFRDAYAKRPLLAVVMLGAVVLSLTAASAALAVRFSGMPAPVQPSVTHPAQGQAPGHGSSPASPGPVPPNCLRGMPTGAGDDDSSNSWYARHCKTNSPSSPRTVASPTRLAGTAASPLKPSAATPISFKPTSAPAPSPPTASQTLTPTTTPTITTTSPTPTPETS
jgi:hypothetical protein